MSHTSQIWVIETSNNQYSVVLKEHATDAIFTPQGYLLKSTNQKALQIVAESMSISDDGLCEGLSLYAMACSTIDFNISLSNSAAMKALYSAFNPEITVTSNSRWQALLQNSTPEQLALYISICGTIGLNNFSYKLMALAELPNFEIYYEMCGLRATLIDNSAYDNENIDGKPNPEDVIKMAYEFDIAYAPYILNDNFSSACNTCAHSCYHLKTFCALNKMFEYIAKYSKALKK